MLSSGYVFRRSEDPEVLDVSVDLILFVHELMLVYPF